MTPEDSQTEAPQGRGATGVGHMTPIRDVAQGTCRAGVLRLPPVGAASAALPPSSIGRCGEAARRLAAEPSPETPPLIMPTAILLTAPRSLSFLSIFFILYEFLLIPYRIVPPREEIVLFSATMSSSKMHSLVEKYFSSVKLHF